MYGMKVLLWDKDGTIKSWYGRYNSPTIWTPGEWQSAECRCESSVFGGGYAYCLDHDHPPCQPIEGKQHAGCGFHAVTSSRSLREFIYWTLDPYLRILGDAVIYVLVEGGGDIAVHENGFRSQYMRIVETFETLWDLEQAYNKIKEAQGES